MAAPSTSFRKKIRSKVIQIPGTRPSLHNNQLLVSSGIPSLDNSIGGGLAVGTVLLIDEDNYGSYSRLMLKYFLAEGAVNQHELFLASGDISPEQLLKELPGPVLDDPGDVGSAAPGAQGDMKIAWRYQNLPQVQSSLTGMKFGHYYDLTKTMDSALIEATHKTLFDVHEETACSQCGKAPGETMNSRYSKLLASIRKHIADRVFGTSTTKQDRNILRIGIHSLGSPQWGESGGVDPSTGKPDPSLCRFLYALRAVMRTSYAACVITMPTHLFQDSVLTSCVHHMCDTVVRLESFTGSDRETNPAFREYHGLFHIIKLPRLNSLICYMPPTLDLAFKLKRKKFMIEKLHLPPDLSETASRSQEDGDKRTVDKSKLDF